MRLVVELFDTAAATRSRKQAGVYIAPGVQAENSYDTKTGLPWALEQEIIAKESSLRRVQDIWQDLAQAPLSTAAQQSVVQETKQTKEQLAKKEIKRRLNAQATVFHPGKITSPRSERKQQISSTIQPIFAIHRAIDWRFGLIQVDFLETPITEPIKIPMSPTAHNRVLEVPPILDNIANAAERSNLSKKPGSTGTIDLGYGIIHLYKDKEAQSDTPSPEVSADQCDLTTTTSDDGTMCAVLAVPANWATSDFLTFIAPAVESVTQMRIMRDALPNRYMVLLKLRNAEDVEIFQELYDAKPYSDLLLDEICHIVRISSVEIKSTDAPPYTFAFPQVGLEFDESRKDKEKEASLAELPTCPVCLERMDASVSGLITVQCSHTFHCLCLKGWANNNCPVCRYSQGRKRDNYATFGGQIGTACAVCAASESLWMCLICGHVGCGRFSGRHAHMHFEETGHTFAYELESQRVWDYAGDQYVHRLIQSKTDGKLVELPSSSSSKTSQKTGPHGIAGDEIAKIEAISIEFSDLLTTQLDSQRAYYAEKVTNLKEEMLDAESRADNAKRGAVALKERLTEAENARRVAMEEDQRAKQAITARLQLLEIDLIPHLEKEKSRIDKKLEKASDLARALNKDLLSERSVTQGLMDNMAKLRQENDEQKAKTSSLEAQIKDLSEQIQDLMFTLTAQARVTEEGGAGGDLQVTPSPSSGSKKHNKGRRAR